MSEETQAVPESQTAPVATKKGGRKPGQAPRKLDEVDVMMRARKLIETLDPNCRTLVASYISNKFGVAQHAS